MWQWLHSAFSPKKRFLPRVSAAVNRALPASWRSYLLSPEISVRWKLAIALITLASAIGLPCPGKAAANMAR